MQIATIAVNRRESEGFFGRTKKFVELGSLPNKHTIHIKHQITAVLGNNGSGKSQFMSGIAEKRKYITSLGNKGVDAQIFDIYNSDGDLQNQLRVSINEVSQPKDRPGKSDSNGFFDGTEKRQEFVQATEYDPKKLEYNKRSQVSSGQFMFAQTLMMIEQVGNNSVLLLDEPDAHLDETYKNQLIVALIKALQVGAQLFIVSHNPLFLTAIQQQSNMPMGVVSFKDKYTPVETMDRDEYIETRAREGSFEYGLVKQLTSLK